MARTAMAIRWGAAVGAAVGMAGIASTGFAVNQVPTTLNDFFGPGTQPSTIVDRMETADRCSSCHGGFDPVTEPFSRWAASMMGRAMHDPLFRACMDVAQQDAAFSGDLCLRCHTPPGWLEGRSTPTDGSALIAKDYDGVSCHTCHRMVDPVYSTGNPSPDPAIIAALGTVQTDPHSGQFVIDPLDRRRGPFDLGSFNKHDWYQSPFHLESEMCATCHDVSNPVFVAQPDGTFAIGALDAPHPTNDKYDEFPVERTYSEWSVSAFAQGPIDMGGRFGGNQHLVSSCQDCHQPKSEGKGCKTGVVRPAVPQHDFNGGNSWVLRAIRVLYPDSETNLTALTVEESIGRATAMLEAASDMALDVDGAELTVTITNQTGHKLPSGYPEGRRAWVNVKFFDDQDTVVAERGHYDATTATLSGYDTKVYEAKLGPDAAVEAVTGVPAGPSFHFAIANAVYKDNRIPPRGFTNAAFAAVQAAPVAYSYPDGAYWDDTVFQIPPGAVRADVTFLYQTSSKEYIEFLRDENTTTTSGQTLYNLWADPAVGNKSAPVVMDFATITFPAVPSDCAGDVNGDGFTNSADFNILASNFGGTVEPNTSGDLTGDGVVNSADFNVLAGDFGCTP